MQPKTDQPILQRMTIAEATQLCDDQCTQLTTFASQSAAATNGIKETKPLIGSRKRAIEKLESGKNALLKEEDEWRRRGANDERTEEGCRWFVLRSSLKLSSTRYLRHNPSTQEYTDSSLRRTMASTAFYQSLLGIKSATSMGSPPNEIRLVYSAGEGVNEDERTLSIVLDASGRMTGASVRSTFPVQALRTATLRWKKGMTSMERCNDEERGVVQDS